MLYRGQTSQQQQQQQQQQALSSSHWARFHLLERFQNMSTDLKLQCLHSSKANTAEEMSQNTHTWSNSAARCWGVQKKKKNWERKPKPVETNVPQRVRLFFQPSEQCLGKKEKTPEVETPEPATATGTEFLRAQRSSSGSSGGDFFANFEQLLKVKQVRFGGRVVALINHDAKEASGSYLRRLPPSLESRLRRNEVGVPGGYLTPIIPERPAFHAAVAAAAAACFLLLSFCRTHEQLLLETYRLECVLLFLFFFVFNVHPSAIRWIRRIKSHVFSPFCSSLKGL